MEHIWKFAIAVIFCCYMINHIGVASECAEETSDTLSVTVLPPCDNSSNSNGIQKKRKVHIQNTPLQDAAVKGQWNLVVQLMNHGHSVNERNAQGYNALHLAIKANHENIVRRFIQGGANVNMRGYNFTTPLILAAESGNANIVENLLTYGANANDFDVNKDKALMVAVRGGFSRVVKVLLPYDKYRETIQSLIIQAYTDKQTDIINILLGAISIDKKTTEICMTKIWNEESFWLLVDNSAENLINILNNSLISEVNERRCHLLKHISTAVTINQETLDEALYHSASLGLVDCMQELLTIGANVNARINGKTPLYIATETCNRESLKFLIDAGATPTPYESLQEIKFLVNTYCD